MSKKLFAITTQSTRSSVYVVEATSEQEAVDLLTSKGQAGEELRTAFKAHTGEAVIALSPVTLEELRNGLDLANALGNSPNLHQDNVEEDDLPSVVVRASEGQNVMDFTTKGLMDMSRKLH